MVNSERVQSGLIERKICILKNKYVFTGHFNLVELKCDWNRFLNYLSENDNNITVNKNDLYEIEFYKNAAYSLSKQQASPYEIKGNLFEKFKIRKLNFSDLEIKTVHAGAFKNCCEQTLEYLDLSKNKLKRIDYQVLSNLKVLNKLNLNSNSDLQLSNENFKENMYLEYIGLASNNLEYLPEKIFKNLNHLQNIDLSNNSLKNLDACTFFPMYSDLKSKKVFVNVTKNYVECNCDVFFLENAANIKLDLTCSGEPNYYNGKHIDELKKEDPNNNECFYNDIKFNCKSKYENASNLLRNYEIFKILVIVFSCLLFISCLCSMCLCCHIRKVNKKVKEADGEFNSYQNNNNNKKGYLLVNATD